VINPVRALLVTNQTLHAAKCFIFAKKIQPRKKQHRRQKRQWELEDKFQKGRRADFLPDGEVLTAKSG
jgi:hypothetical protein